MKITNNKELKIIGYPQSLLTQDSVEVVKKFIQDKVSIITPQDFLTLNNKDQYRYFVGFGLDLIERRFILDWIDNNLLEVVSFIHPTAEVHGSAKIGKGVAIMNHSTIMQNVEIGNYCIIETYCLVAHNSKVGNNCILHSGTMIAGATTIGDNCMFNFKSAALNKINIPDNVIVGAVSTVTKDLTESGMYAGTPARRIKPGVGVVT